MMLTGLFRRNRRQDVVETLYQRIAAPSRAPFLYLDLGVPDTVEGRFEAVTLHLTLVLRRMRQLPEPAAEQLAQDLVDCFFRHLDASLRELAVGDTAVPRRMKALGEAFNGRSRSYDEALNAETNDRLAATLGRNVLGSAEPAHALAGYVRQSATQLEDSSLEDFLREGPRFAPPQIRS